MRTFGILIVVIGFTLTGCSKQPPIQNDAP